MTDPKVVETLLDKVSGVASFLVGYGDMAEFAAKQLRDALSEYDTAIEQAAAVEAGGGWRLVPVGELESLRRDLFGAAQAWTPEQIGNWLLDKSQKVDAMLSALPAPPAPGVGL